MPVPPTSAGSDACINFTNTQEVRAWECWVAPVNNSVFTMTITDQASGPLLSLPGDTSPGYTYGARTPMLNFTSPGVLASEYAYMARGPAYFFQSAFDFLVNRHEDNSIDTEPGAAVQVGDRPIFCYWNATLLEVAVFVNETSDAASSSSSDAALPLSPKVVEMRNTTWNTGPRPYCQQMQILADGSAVPLVPSTAI